jgi:GT2 family glycosyltransferase
MTTPLISFITVDYNGLQDTIGLIHSIQHVVHSVSYEIIVVDNASRTDDAAVLRETFSDITVVRSNSNLGFAGGNNLGMKFAKGRYFFFINNDTYLEEDHLAELIQRFDISPKAGGVSPKLRFGFEPRNIQYAGFTPMSPITLRNSTRGYGETDNGQYDTPTTTAFLHGAAMLIPRRLIDEVGTMSEVFFLYYEEMDWCARIRRAGYELWYEPCQTVFHKESQSTGKMSELHIFFLTRNRLLFAYRNLCGYRRALTITYLATIATFKNALVFCIKGHFALAFTVLKAVDAFFTLPHKKN